MTVALVATLVSCGVGMVTRATRDAAGSLAAGQVAAVEDVQAGNDAASRQSAAERRAYVEEWAPRIDAYLEGSPLAGYGEAFAEAAYDEGVDPRWSPAISCVESGRGANCYYDHNAWGWGYYSWESWEEAIRAHVAGLAAYYGTTNTLAGAAKYCPYNYEEWYALVDYQMSLI